jgi:hypothetical protein
MTIIDNNFFCNFIYIEDKWECSKCGTQIDIADDNPDPPLWPCFSPLKEKDNIATNVKEFMSDKISQKEIAEESTISYRYSICSSCEHFQNSICDKCGCAITRERNYINKLASKSESCPVFKW